MTIQHDATLYHTIYFDISQGEPLVTTCLTQVFFKTGNNVATTMMILDTISNAYNKRGRIRQVELDK